MVQENDGEFSVKDIMNPNVVSLGPESSLKEASELMSQQKIGSIVIVDGDKPVGIITKK